MIERIFPYNSESVDTYSFIFDVTKLMVKDFAQLTGDQSSLHAEESFGRRSMYRENVAHGMLPVCFVTKFLLDQNLMNSQLGGFSAMFLKPVMVDDRLRFVVKEVGEEENKRDFEFKIFNCKKDILVTV